MTSARWQPVTTAHSTASYNGLCGVGKRRLGVNPLTGSASDETPPVTPPTYISVSNSAFDGFPPGSRL